MSFQDDFFRIVHPEARFRPKDLAALSPLLPRSGDLPIRLLSQLCYRGINQDQEEHGTKHYVDDLENSQHRSTVDQKPQNADIT